MPIQHIPLPWPLFPSLLLPRHHTPRLRVYPLFPTQTSPIISLACLSPRQQYQLRHLRAAQSARTTNAPLPSTPTHPLLLPQPCPYTRPISQSLTVSQTKSVQLTLPSWKPPILSQSPIPHGSATPIISPAPTLCPSSNASNARNCPVIRPTTTSHLPAPTRRWYLLTST